jgi:membrane-bound lytic murein transglycosylase D
MLGVNTGVLETLNAELRYRATPDRGYELRVPVGSGPALLARLDSIPRWSSPRPAYVTHRVRRGETLSKIARRYKTSARLIARANGIRNPNRIGVGTRLKIPTSAAVAAQLASSSGSGSQRTGSAATGYTVRRGDSLYAIAKRFRTTVGRLKRDNNLRGTRIYPGQKLRVTPGSRGGLHQYTVRRGDSPGKIANAHKVSLSVLLQANGLSRRSTIYPGQKLVIPD